MRYLMLFLLLLGLIAPIGCTDDATVPIDDTLDLILASLAIEISPGEPCGVDGTGLIFSVTPKFGTKSLPKFSTGCIPARLTAVASHQVEYDVLANDQVSITVTTTIPGEAPIITHSIVGIPPDLLE